MKNMKYPRVMLSSNGNNIMIAENLDEWIFCRLWSCFDIGIL